MQPSIKISPRFFLLFFVCALFACTPSGSPGQNGVVRRSPLTSESAKQFQAVRVNSILVMPLSGSAPGEPISPGLTELLMGSLERKTSLDLVNRSDRDRATNEIRKAQTLPQALKAQSALAGKALDAQGVLYGVITNYEESSGSRLGADRLASAGFKLWLIDPKTSQTLWTASYENAEEPLSENLFRLGEKMRSGVGFRTADELIQLGFDAAADELESLRHTPK